ncbi:helix-turn-helix domain-containing protein [Acinetobacter baumannii]|nr:helix-turn-helix domain-containing protein [Acinetobacter baumannii]
MKRHKMLLLKKEDDSYGSSVRADSYIRVKTQLTRSDERQILEDLKPVGFIKMEEGRIIKINKLPARY